MKYYTVIAVALVGLGCTSNQTLLVEAQKCGTGPECGSLWQAWNAAETRDAERDEYNRWLSCGSVHRHMQCTNMSTKQGFKRLKSGQMADCGCVNTRVQADAMRQQGIFE